jgi:ATP-binding protein involved in chromosome partitioning
MFGVMGRAIEITPEGAMPAVSHLGIKIASMDLMLAGDDTPVAWKGQWQDSAVWRGALEMGVIRELLADIAWGDLDLLLIDMPPASSDKPPVIANLIPDMDGAIMVTIPTEVSQHIVRKSINFASKELKIPIVGLIENMTSFICPECGHKSDLFSEGSIKEMGIPVIGEIPFDSRMSRSADRGLPFIIEFPDALASLSFISIADKIIDQYLNKERR